MRRSRHLGFTLIELLVVIGIIAILVTIALPAINAARETSNQNTCRGKLKQLGIAFSAYADQHHVFPPGIISDRDGRYTAAENAGKDPGNERGNSSSSAFTMLLPFISQGSYSAAYNSSHGCASLPNTTAVSAVINEFLCPSNPRGAQLIAPDYFLAPGAGPTDYILNLGACGIMQTINSQQNMRNMTAWGRNGEYIKAAGPFNVNFGASRQMMARDGLSNTFLLGEGSSGVPDACPSDTGGRPLQNPSPSATVEQAWAQGYIPSGGDGGYGGVFGVTCQTCSFDRDNQTPIFLDTSDDASMVIKLNEMNLTRGRVTSQQQSYNGRDDSPALTRDSIRGFGSFHGDISFFMMADGTVQSVGIDVNDLIYIGKSTIRGSEIVSE